MPKRPETVKTSVSIEQTSRIATSGGAGGVRRSRKVTVNGVTVVDEVSEASSGNADSPRSRKGAGADAKR